MEQRLATHRLGRSTEDLGTCRADQIPGAPLAPSPWSLAPAPDSVLFFLDRLGVRIGVEQFFGFFGEVARLDDEDPAFAVRVLVDRLGLVAERAVDGDDFAGHRSVNIRRG